TCVFSRHVLFESDKACRRLPSRIGQYDEDELIERGAGTVSGLVDRDDGGDDAAVGNADDPAASTWGRRCGSDTVWAASRDVYRRLSPGLGNCGRRRLAGGSDHRCAPPDE